MDDTFDRWIQRVTLAALLALAAALLGVGITFYAPRSDAEPPAASHANPSENP